MAVAPGNTTISAAVNIPGATQITQLSSCKVTVVGITLDQTQITISKDNDVQLIATTTAAPDTIQWTSLDQEIATVDNTGKVTAVGEGETTIQATVMIGGKTATAECRITVENKSPEDIANGYVTFINNTFWHGMRQTQVAEKLKELGAELHDGLWCASFVGCTSKVFGISKVIPTNNVSCASIYRQMTQSEGGYQASGYHQKGMADPNKCFVSNSFAIDEWEDFDPHPGDLMFIKWATDTHSSTFTHIAVVYLPVLTASYKWRCHICFWQNGLCGKR